MLRKEGRVLRKESVKEGRKEGRKEEWMGAAAARAGAFGLGFFLLVGLVNAWRGSLRKISSIRRRALVASVNPCADASAKNRRASWTFWETPVPVM